VDALELIRLGRALTKLGEEAMRGGSAQGLPNGPSLILRDVFAHPGSSISEIVTRTGLPQSYVSESVRRLRSTEVVVIEEDPRDHRRTLVTVSARHRQTVARKSAAPVDSVIAAAVGERAAPEALKACELLAGQLAPQADGPIMRQLRGDA
jgi:DNA-binding MarR family transcriptional regulator